MVTRMVGQADEFRGKSTDLREFPETKSFPIFVKGSERKENEVSISFVRETKFSATESFAFKRNESQVGKRASRRFESGCESG